MTIQCSFGLFTAPSRLAVADSPDVEVTQLGANKGRL